MLCRACERDAASRSLARRSRFKDRAVHASRPRGLETLPLLSVPGTVLLFAAVIGLALGPNGRLLCDGLPAVSAF